jgi:hypothetical protein
MQFSFQCLRRRSAADQIGIVHETNSRPCDAGNLLFVPSHLDLAGQWMWNEANLA